MQSKTTPHTPTPSRFKRFLAICLLFFVTSLVGWLLETIGFYISQKALFERGFLSLPFCTLYGFSTVGIYLIIKTPFSGIWLKLARLPSSKLARVFTWLASFLLYALSASLLATAVEYLTGLLFHHAFNLRLWNYNGFENNLNGYITLEFSVYWGLLATVGMALIWHPLRILFLRFNTKILGYVVLLLTVALAADFIFNVIYVMIYDEHYKILPGVFDYYARLKRFNISFPIKFK